MTHKPKGIDPDDYESAETIVLDDDSVMNTREFRRLVAFDPDLLDEIEPPDLDSRPSS